jgi:Tfp pilus assembly major pilin PilA
VTTRGFSLIEAMVSAAMVGILGAGSIALVTHVTTQGAEGRLRALATADALSTVEEITQLVGVAAAHGGSRRFCELAAATGGPLAGERP